MLGLWEEETMSDLDGAILGRHSIRKILPEPAPREVVDEALALAQHAPSNSNILPWRAVLRAPPQAAAALDRGLQLDRVRRSFLAVFIPQPLRRATSLRNAYGPNCSLMLRPNGPLIFEG
jgi:nitroreductase